MRVYLNNLDAEHVWSTDDGPGTEERHWDGVVIACDAYTQTDINKRGSKTEPCCWLECKGYLVEAPCMNESGAPIQPSRYAVIRD